MSDWIDVNLPWKKDTEYKTPDFPREIVDARVREKFGGSQEELASHFENKYGKSYYELRTEIRSRFEESLISTDDNLTWEEIENRIDEAINLSTDPVIVEIADFHRKTPLIQEYIETIQEVKDWGLEYDRAREAAFAQQKNYSFYHSPLKRPGVLIEIKNNDKVSQYLIGDINESGGVCDDCREFGDDAIVLRAKVIMDSKNDAVDAIRNALEVAGGRWSEWGNRAVQVAEILEAALTPMR